MHFATATKVVIGMRVVMTTGGAIIASGSATIATTAAVNITYALGYILGAIVSSIGVPILLITIGLLVAVNIQSDECQQNCECIRDDEKICRTVTIGRLIRCTEWEIDNKISQGETEYCYVNMPNTRYPNATLPVLTDNNKLSGQWCKSYIGNGERIDECRTVSQPVYGGRYILSSEERSELREKATYRTEREICENKNDCDYEMNCDCENDEENRTIWLQVVFAALDDQRLNNNLTSAKGCFIVAYEYDLDHDLSIQYNPGINEKWLASKALSPEQVKQRFPTNKNIEIKNDIETAKGYDRAYWNSINVDTECRRWQPGDLIPTK